MQHRPHRKYARDVLLKTPAAVLLVARLFPTDASLLPPGQSSRLVATVGLALQPVAVQKFNTLQPPLGAAYLSNLAVDKKLQRQGIGRAMVAVCEDVAAAAGAPAVCLHVNADDPPVQRLYQAAGYTELGRDNPLVCRLQGVTRPRILMRKQTAAAAAGAM